MDYEAFKKKIAEDVKQWLSACGYDDVELNFWPVEKANFHYEALAVRMRKTNVGVNLNVESAYEVYKRTGAYTKTCEDLMVTLMRGFEDAPVVDSAAIRDYDIMKSKLVIEVISAEENAELLINGKRVESDYTFTADSETMKVEVAFTFDATSLDGKQLVTFEELYDLSNPDEPKKVTEHKDIEDKGQTITFKEKPEEPEKPETPPTPEKPNRPSDSPKTGDSTNVMAFIVMLLASAGGLAGTYLYKRRKMKKS